MPSTLKNWLNRFSQIISGLFTSPDNPRIEKNINALKEVNLFKGFTRRQLRDLAFAVHHREYKPGENIYHEDDPGLGLYIIEKGHVQLICEEADGHVLEVRQLSETDFFGELSILGEHRRMETAQAVAQTRLLGLFLPDLKTVLRRNPRVGARLALSLAQHLASIQVEVTRVMIQKEGKVPALRLMQGASMLASKEQHQL